MSLSVFQQGGAILRWTPATGKERWRHACDSELLSAPAISENVVVLRSRRPLAGF